MERFAAAIATGAAPDVTPADGLAVQAFVDAAYRAVAERGGRRPWSRSRHERDGRGAPGAGDGRRRGRRRAGPLADALRDRLAGPAAPPAAIVDTTGDPAGIAGGLARVDDLGTVVLAGPVPEGPVALDLYADVHVRGLTVVGVAPDGGGGAPAGVEPADAGR